jgi:iron complex outermembrane receptor protein
MLTRCSKAGAVLLSSVCSVCWLPARAQTNITSVDNSNAGSGGTTALQEVVVTAQQRAERSQDVPIAIEAFSAEQLSNAGVMNVQDLDIVTPGLNYGNVVGYAQPHLRGIGTTASGPAVENPVATYVDGVYYASMIGSLLNLVNVADVEVDKGPQGTLFGRNATGGLIQIKTLTPQQDFSGTAGVTYGNYNTWGATGYVTGGITPKIAADLSFYFQDQVDGFGRNYYTGQNVNWTSDLALRSKWLWTPFAAASGTLALDFEETHDAPALSPAPGTLALGGQPVSPQNLNGVFQPFGTIKQGGVSFDWQQNLGFGQLRSITAYRRGIFDSAFDGALTPIPELALNIHIREPEEQFSQEIRLLSNAATRISWVGGLYWYQADAREAPVQAAGGLLSPLASTNTYPDQKSLSGAMFGQVTAAVTPATHLTLGARYTVERRNFHTSGALISDDGSTIPESAPDVHQVYSKPTWRVSLDHQLASDQMVYASYNRGFKSGGYNNELLPTTAYAPEVLDAYEVGAKSEWLNRTLRVNTSLFFYDYKNIQAVRYPAGLLEVYNGASAQLYGLDLDAQCKVTNVLIFSGGLELLRSKYTSFPQADYTVPADGGGTIFETFDATGKRLAQAPGVTLDVSADYSVPVPVGIFAVNVTYGYNSGWDAEPDNRLHQPAYSLVNTQLSLTSKGRRNNVKIWGHNLSNSQYAQSLASQANGDYIQYAPPRTFGVTFEHRF